MSGTYGDTNEGAFKLAITQFGFILYMVAAETLIALMVLILKMLQNKTCDIMEAVKDVIIITSDFGAKKPFRRMGWPLPEGRSNERVRGSGPFTATGA